MKNTTQRRRFTHAAETHGLYVIIVLVLIGASTVLFNAYHHAREAGLGQAGIVRTTHEMAWATLATAGLITGTYATKLLRRRRLVHRRKTIPQARTTSVPTRETEPADTGQTRSAQRLPVKWHEPRMEPEKEWEPAPPRPNPPPATMRASRPENPLNLQHVRLTTRIIGVGIIPDRQSALRMAQTHGYRILFSEEDEHTYVEFPEIGVDVHTIRHQTQVRTDLAGREPESAFQQTAAIIEHALKTTMPELTLPHDATMPDTLSEDAGMRNRHPFDSGVTAIIITLENTVDDHAPSEQAPYATQESQILHSEFERDTSLYTTLSWQNLDRSMRNGKMPYTAETIMRTRSAMPSRQYLTKIYQEVAQNTRARTLRSMHEHRKPVHD